MKIRLLIRGVILTWVVLNFSVLRTRMANQGSLDATFLLASEQVVAASVTEQQGQSVPKGNPGGEQEGRAASLTIDNGNHKLEFNAETGKLESLRAIVAADQEFIQGSDRDPVFVIQYLDGRNRFRQVDSGQASEIIVNSVDRSAGGAAQGSLLTADFRQLDGLQLDATVTVRTVPDDPLSYWSIAVNNQTGLLITDVQFPFIVVPYHLAGGAGSESLLRPYWTGRLLRAPKPHELEPDNPHTWQFHPENGDFNHYPGLTFAQFLAYFNDRAGIFVSCRDSSGAIKLIKPTHRGSGIRLGMAHVGDWPRNGKRQLDYDVVLRAFTGDWYDAAELYRQWSLKQPWAATPLHARKDTPDWLLDSPPHIIVRIQGILDEGPTAPNPEFLPYPKIIPLLEKIADRIEAPLVPVIMSWERPGPWIYPESLPPAGGAESLAEFTKLARDRGWHVGTFCNGTRWVTHHHWSGYDGSEYLAEQGGEKSLCRTHDQQLWRESWDQTWRPSHPACLGVPMTREIAVDFFEQVVGYGLDWIQFLDQNVGCSSFPCYATGHGHPAAPGKWMTRGMQGLLDDFHRLARKTEQQSRGERTLTISVETPPNEYCMPNFHLCDVRVVPPGHVRTEREFIPLYHFLYHEFIVIQGGFGSAPEPYHMPIRNSYNLVVGQIPGGVLTGDGRLLNKDTFNWAPWEPAVGSNDDSLTVLRRTTALRRGKGRDFLVYGRMQRPAHVSGTKTMRWQWGGRDHQIPAVFHSAWKSPQGRLAVVLANWTTTVQTVSVVDPRLNQQAVVSLWSDELNSTVSPVDQTGLQVSLPPLSCALIEQTNQ